MSCLGHHIGGTGVNAIETGHDNHIGHKENKTIAKPPGVKQREPNH